MPIPGADLLDAAGVSGALGAALVGENPALTYPEIIESRWVLERTLLARYPPSDTTSPQTVLSSLGVRGPNMRERMYRGVRLLTRLVTVSANPRSGIIQVAVVSKDSLLSAFTANRLVEELQRFNLETRASRGRAARRFIEQRLADTKASLVRAEAALAQFRTSNLRIGNSPGLLLEQARLERDVAIQSDLYLLLSRQFELARVEELRDTPTFSVLEPAVPPVRKYRPLVIINALSAAAFAIGLFYLRAALERRRLPRREPVRAG
jgi:uncharacterized protein involved in exopolysaccharide biosynthesis